MSEHEDAPWNIPDGWAFESARRAQGAKGGFCNLRCELFKFLFNFVPSKRFVLFFHIVRSAELLNFLKSVLRHFQTII